MRHGTSGRRQRGRGNSGRRGGSSKTQVFDSNGPDVRIRGTAHQVMEKYLALSKDAASTGDVVLAESYSQHAEHYQRVINEANKNVQDTRGASDDRKDKSQNTGQKEKGSDADLSLPPSILGKSSKASSSQKSGTRTAEEVPAG